jgi:hypothetical protein
VTLALSQFTAPRDITKALNVHYLMRGNVDRAASGYAVTLFMVEGEAAHVLGTEDLSIPTQSLVPRWDDEIDHATGKLVFYALQSEVERARGKPDSALDVRDLAFRAFVDWAQYRRSNDSKGAYVAATSLLRRALAFAPDDPIALRLTAQINLCDCIDALCAAPRSTEHVRHGGRSLFAVEIRSAKGGEVLCDHCSRTSPG